MSEYGPKRELLEAVHTFPGPYTVKAIGPHTETFVNAIRAAATAAHTGDDEIELTARASGKGNHIAVTATIVAETSDAVFVLYAELKNVENLRMLL